MCRVRALCYALRCGALRLAHTSHPHTTCLSSTDLPGRRSAEDPAAPLLGAVCVSPSHRQPPGSGAAKGNKRNSRTACQGENYLRQMLKTTCRKSLHLAGTPQLVNAANRQAPRRRRERRRTREGPKQPCSPQLAATGASERARNTTSTIAGQIPPPTRPTTRRT